jgi:hypothetical protein
VGDHPAFPEIARRADKLSGANNAKSLIARLLAHGRWNPDAFVDACDAAMNLPESDLQVKLLREIQSFETEALLEYLLGDTE